MKGEVKINGHRVSLSEQQTVDLLICHGLHERKPKHDDDYVEQSSPEIAHIPTNCRHFSSQGSYCGYMRTLCTEIMS